MNSTEPLDLREIVLDLMSSVLEIGASDDFHSPISGTIVLLDAAENRETFCGSWIVEERLFVIDRVLDWEVVDADDDNDPYYLALELEIIAEFDSPAEAANELLHMAEANGLEPRARWSIHG